MPARDSNGTELSEGDTVQVIKDLKVKGSSLTLKRGITYKETASPMTMRRWSVTKAAARWC